MRTAFLYGERDIRLTEIEELLPDVLDGTIRPGLVFDVEMPLADVAAGYAAMDERRAVKVLLRP
jgi:hypothetical protein